jgi:hypothetical protein
MARCALLASPHSHVSSLAAVAAACSGDDDTPASVADAGSVADTGSAGDAGLLDVGPVDTDSGVKDTGPPDDSTCTPRSGTRLKVRWFQSAEGTRIFDSMYDSTLGTRCVFRKTSDGQYRCLPNSAIDPLGAGASSPVFADPQCSEHVSLNIDCATAGPYYSEVTSNACDKTYSAFQVGAQVPSDGGADAAIFSNLTGTCGKASVFPPAAVDVRALTAMPDSAFVSATLGSVSAGRYSMTTYEATDGARYCALETDIQDTTLATPTYSRPDPDHVVRLMPDISATGNFADSVCTTPATLVTSACSTPAPFAVEALDTCGTSYVVRSVGALLDAGFFESAPPDAGSCTSASAPRPDAGATWHALTAPLDAGMFGEVKTETTAGVGRLHYNENTSEGGFRWRTADAYDTQLGKTCTVLSPLDAKTRCAVYDSIATTWYSDDKCTQPMYLVAPSPCLSATFPSATSTALVSACPPRVAHISSTAYTGAMWTKTKKGCFSIVIPGSVFYGIVDDIDPTTFAEVTEVIE